MSFCPSCNQPTSDPEALFCAYCGFALPEGSARGESFPAFAADGPPLTPDALSARSLQGPAWAAEPNPKAVAVGLGALATAVVLAIVLSYGSGSSTPDQAMRPTAAPSYWRDSVGTRIAAIRRQPVALLHYMPTTSAGTPRALVHFKRYRAGGYSFAYPSGWQVSRSDQPVSSYRETVLESAGGAAKVTVDYSPGERTDPASKASEVEAATSSTPGYRRISFGPTTVDGRAAFAWEFTVADADPRRADLFIRAPNGGFALLAHGLDLARARLAARKIAGSLSAAR